MTVINQYSAHFVRTLHTPRDVAHHAMLVVVVPAIVLGVLWILHEVFFSSHCDMLVIFREVCNNAPILLALSYPLAEVVCLALLINGLRLRNPPKGSA